MLWLILDITIPVLAVITLAVLALSLWRRVRALTKRVGEASDAVGVANDALATAQAATPGHRRVG